MMNILKLMNVVEPLAVSLVDQGINNCGIKAEPIAEPPRFGCSSVSLKINNPSYFCLQKLDKAFSSSYQKKVVAEISALLNQVDPIGGVGNYSRINDILNEQSLFDLIVIITELNKTEDLESIKTILSNDSTNLKSTRLFAAIKIFDLISFKGKKTSADDLYKMGSVIISLSSDEQFDLLYYLTVQLTDICPPDTVRDLKTLIRFLGENSKNYSSISFLHDLIIGMGIPWELQFNLGRLGIKTFSHCERESLSKNTFNNFISNNPALPFTGSGATGVNPTLLKIPLLDQLSLFIHWIRKGRKMANSYTNPLTRMDLSEHFQWLDKFWENTNIYAQIILNQPISTIFEKFYPEILPKRAELLRMAAISYNLEPELLAAFIFTEQIDQSRNEDAADFNAAISLLEANTSIGLAQVRVGNIVKNNLFSDLLSDRTIQGLTNPQIAYLLASDEFNIFASAKFIRGLANKGATMKMKEVENVYPDKDKRSFNMKYYQCHSSQWSPTHIETIGTVYNNGTWRIQGWGGKILTAYENIKKTKIFRYNF